MAQIIKINSNTYDMSRINNRGVYGSGLSGLGTNGLGACKGFAAGNLVLADDEAHTTDPNTYMDLAARGCEDVLTAGNQDKTCGKPCTNKSGTYNKSGMMDLDERSCESVSYEPSVYNKVSTDDLVTSDIEPDPSGLSAHGSYNPEDGLCHASPVNSLNVKNEASDIYSIPNIFDADDDCNKSNVIDIRALRQNCRKLDTGLISPAVEEVSIDLAPEHAAEPIKSMDDIIRISQYLIGQKRYRDNMLFIVGINFGLRVSDLRALRFTHLINDDCTFRDRFPILEKKTRNTRKHQRNRYITINTAVVEAVTLYLENTPGVRLSDYMFRSQSNNGSNENKPISKQAIDQILKGIARDLGLGNRMATHTLRKTFAYHQMVMSGNDPRKLLLLQKMFGHSTSAQTLDYIGITSEEIDDAYRKLNLGSIKHNYLVDSDICEYEVFPA